MIWHLLTGMASVVAFMVVLSVSGAVRVARKTLDLGASAARAMRDPALDEAAREKAAQRASLAMFGTFLGLSWRAALALVAAALPILAAGTAGLVPVGEELAFLSRIDVIAGFSLIGVAGWILAARLSHNS